MNEEEKKEITSTEIEKYLRKNPDFFNEHLDLLENLTIPHPSGNAVSLISKQLEIFRSRHHEMESQLTALIEIARENDTSFNRMHELTLAMLDAATIEDALSNLDQALFDCFLADFVSRRPDADQRTRAGTAIRRSRPSGGQNECRRSFPGVRHSGIIHNTGH